MLETLKAAKTLTKEGFKVMAYCSDDPIFTKQKIVSYRLVSYKKRVKSKRVYS